MHALARAALCLNLAAALTLASSPASASPFGVPTIDTLSQPSGDESESDQSGEAEEPEEDPKVIEAKNEYRAGSDAYALGNYEKAVSHFERAYELSQEPALLFNLGQSYTRWYDISGDVEHLKKARRLYENYVLNVGATGLDEQGQADARADAQHRIAEVDRRIAAHEGKTPEEGPGPVDETKPVHEKAWFWVTIVGGAAVIGGVVAAVVLTRPKPFEPELGTIGGSSGRGPQGGGLTLRF